LVYVQEQNAFFCIILHFPVSDGTKHVIIGKKPNILEKLLQIVAGEPISEYNPSISKIGYAFW